MSSKPTPREDLYRWHTQALTNAQFGIENVVDGEAPQCGWYKRRLVKGGIWVPGRVWMYQPTDDESGDLIGDEELQCEVDGQYVDPADAWSWLASNPITEADFKYLTATRTWSEENAPDEPYANPRQPVDWRKVPTPIFATKESAS